MAKVDIYQTVTDRILELLDRGTVPWRQPIAPGSGGNGMPKNLASGKAYRGINVFLLSCTAMCQGYASAYWMTYKQAKAKGGQVRKGEKASPVVFWKTYDTKDRDTGEDKTVPVIRYYNVFNAEQCDGIEIPDAVTPAEDTTPFVPIEEAERIAAGYVLGPKVEHQGNRACYRATSDTVRMPEPNRFDLPENYYSTLFHELAHSTGHSKRLDRGLDTNLQPFGSADYSKEELVAEMGAAFLSATAGISPPTIEQSAAYIEGWRRKLKGDKKLLIQASGAGQRAADLILGMSWDDAKTPPANNNTPAKEPNTERASEAATPPRVDAELRVNYRKMKTTMRVCPPPPTNLDLSSDGDLEQLRHYAGNVQRWYDGHLDAWLEAGVLKEDPRRSWAEPMHPIGSGEQLKASLQNFPLPGQANLNSTATSEERSAYIHAVLGWWNAHVEDWADNKILDHHKNPVVNPNPTPPEAVHGNFPANVPGCGS